MRVWAPANIKKIRLKREMGSLELERAMIRAAPIGIEPTNNHIRNIIKGKTKDPGIRYVLLFAHVLGCTADDLCEEEKR